MEKELTKLYEENKMRYWKEDAFVSEKNAYDPTSSLPEKTKGKIEEIKQNPEVKRKWLEALKGNLNAFKNGKYMKQIPDF